MKKLILYHGSQEIVEKPDINKGKAYNDYGRGFYCTENLELAKEWSVKEDVDGFANKYEIDLQGLKILNLNDDKYNILHWLNLLVNNRVIKASVPVVERGMTWLNENVYVDIESYDIIRGYRADDSYFSFAKAFLSNQISLEQLSYAMKLGKLGEQVVLKSQEAFDRICFDSYENADSSIYYPKRKKRDDDAREAYYKVIENDDFEGIFMRDLITGRVSINDI